MIIERKILMASSIITVVMLVAVAWMFLRIQELDELYECQHAIMQIEFNKSGGLSPHWFKHCRSHYEVFTEDGRQWGNFKYGNFK